MEVPCALFNLLLCFHFIQEGACFCANYPILCSLTKQLMAWNNDDDPMKSDTWPKICPINQLHQIEF